MNKSNNLDLRNMKIALTFTFVTTVLLSACVQRDNNVKDHNIEKTMKKIEWQSLYINPIELIGEDWMLITAGTDSSFNMMTASWGTIGHLWGKPVAIVFIRPQRYTFEFVEREPHFTLSFFDEKYREALNICGSKSGRDIDKVKATGLTPMVTENSIAFREANMIIECRKIYGQFLQGENFNDTTIVKKNYAKGDFHKMYVGEIVNIWRK